MMNGSELVIKTVNANKCKWLSHLDQKVSGASARIHTCRAAIVALPGRQRASNLAYFFNGTWKPCIPPAQAGSRAVRQGDRNAGLRGWKKQMLSCNEADTGCDITRCESKPTSSWSSFARELAESSLWRKANDGDD